MTYTAAVASATNNTSWIPPHQSGTLPKPGLFGVATTGTSTGRYPWTGAADIGCTGELGNFTV